MSTPARKSTVEAEIADLEERLRHNVVLVSEDGQPFLAKPKVVAAHQPGSVPKFTRVEMTDMKIIDHGTALS
jgi:hypothetical protein